MKINKLFYSSLILILLIPFVSAEVVIGDDTQPTYGVVIEHPIVYSGGNGSTYNNTYYYNITGNYINKSGDVMGEVDNISETNRFRYNMPAGYTPDNHSVISLGGEFDGALMGLIDYVSTQIFGQAKNDGTAANYVGVLGYADRQRNNSEIAGFTGIGAGGAYPGVAVAIDNENYSTAAFLAEGYSTYGIQSLQMGTGYLAKFEKSGGNSVWIDNNAVINSNVPNGNPPLIVDSTNLVTNLNSDLWDGYNIPVLVNNTYLYSLEGVLSRETVSTPVGECPEGYVVNGTTSTGVTCVLGGNISITGETYNVTGSQWLYNTSNTFEFNETHLIDIIVSLIQTYVGSNYLMLNTTNGPLTGNLEISKSDPELKLNDSLYSRFTRSDTNNKAVVYNQITKS